MVVTTFYEDEAVRITSSDVTVGGRTHPLEEFAEVRHDGLLRGVRAWAYWIGRGVALLALVALVPGLVVGIVVAVRKVSGLADTATAVGLVVGIWGALSIGAWEFGVEGYRGEVYGAREIRARLRDDEEIVVVRTTDLVAFGQIYRALGTAFRGRGS
jgi:hypothetical protein